MQIAFTFIDLVYFLSILLVIFTYFIRLDRRLTRIEEHLKTLCEPPQKPHLE